VAFTPQMFHAYEPVNPERDQSLLTFKTEPVNLPKESLKG
jgi:hypothetical protein